MVAPSGRRPAQPSTEGRTAPPAETGISSPDREVTLQDVALAAGVHYSTVSRALDPSKAFRVGQATRNHVESVARQMGYRRHMGASGLKRGRTHTVSVVVADLGNPFISPVLRGIANRLEEASLMPLITETQDDPARLARVLNHAVERRVEAVIMAAARLGSAAVLIDTAKRRIPVLLADRNVPQSGLPACTHDNAAGGVLAARHLLELGHRRVVQLRGPLDVSTFLDRGRAFSQTLADAGVDEVALPETASVPTLDEGRHMMGLVLARYSDRPTAVFAHNDLMALGALDVLERNGLRCPQDVSVIGYNDSQLVDRTNPPLTTIRLHGEELGRLIAEMTVAAIASPSRPPLSLTLPPTLIVRQSTAAVEPQERAARPTRRSAAPTSRKRVT